VSDLQLPPARTPRDELADATAHGHIYLRRLVRAQLGLSMVSLVAFGGIVGVLPLIVDKVPWLMRTTLFGIPVGLLLVAVPLYPFFASIGWLHQRRADALDEEFRALVRDE
jgi:hypothetical protein